jgi:hypothetical protein
MKPLILFYIYSYRPRAKNNHQPPTPEEEDALCGRACGQSLCDLVRKAIRNGDSLTYKESMILATGVVSD